MLLVQLLEAFVQSLIAASILQNGERFGGRLAIRSEERDAMAVACGIDADANTVEERDGGHGGPPHGRKKETRVATCEEENGVSVLRNILGKAFLVISGRGRMMYQNLQPKPEGTIFSKRSKPQGTYSSPHDAALPSVWQNSWK
jgi:hypothetical protein